VRHEQGTDHSPSFGVKVCDGESRVHCFSCDFSGTQTRLLMAMREAKLPLDFAQAMEAILVAEQGGQLDLGPGDYEDAVFGEPTPPHLFDEMLTDVFDRVAHRTEAWDYLVGRGLDGFTIEQLDLRWDPYRKRVLFPVRDWEGRLRGLHGRAIYDSDLKYLMYSYQDRTNPHVWLGEDRCNPELPVLMPESVFDLAAAHPFYTNALSPLSASISGERLHRVRHLADVVTLFDSGEAGNRARETVSKALTNTRVRHLVPPPNEDAGSMGQLDLAELLQTQLEVL